MKSHKGEETRQLFPAGQIQPSDLEDPKASFISKQPETDFLEDLKDKWCTKKLQKRFEERINSYIICNPDTRADLLSHI